MTYLKIQDSCINCDVCEPNCPNEAIFFDELLGFYQINPDLCTFCTGFFEKPHCQTLCPVECIEFFEEP